MDFSKTCKHLCNKIKKFYCFQWNIDRHKKKLLLKNSSIGAVAAWKCTNKFGTSLNIHYLCRL